MLSHGNYAVTSPFLANSRAYYPWGVSFNMDDIIRSVSNQKKHKATEPDGLAMEA